GLFFVRYQPQRSLVACIRMSPVVELAHRRLCDYLWAGGEVRVTPAHSLCELLKVDRKQLPGVLRDLRRAGWKPRAGRLSHPYATSVFVEATEAHRAAVRRGNLRWGKGIEPSDEEHMQASQEGHLKPAPEDHVKPASEGHKPVRVKSTVKK